MLRTGHQLRMTTTSTRQRDDDACEPGRGRANAAVGTHRRHDGTHGSDRGSREAGSSPHDRHPVQPGVVAADDQVELRRRSSAAAASVANGWGRNSPNGRTSWATKLPSDLDSMAPARQAVEVPTAAGWASAASRGGSPCTSRSRQHGSPRSLMSPAPNSIRKASQRNSEDAPATAARSRRCRGRWPGSPPRAGASPSRSRRTCRRR